MKFIHVADIHASKERLPQTLSILSTLTERVKEKDIDFILFAGDFWDSTITATKGSGFSDIISAIRELERYTFLVFIYGTPSHEPGGSLEAFKSEKTTVIDKIGTTFSVGFRTELICIPEPRRSDYIADSVSKTNELINKSIELAIKLNKELNKKLFDHRIVIYHGEIKDAVYQNGIVASSPTAIPKDLLQTLKADYYALGHIHMPQEVFKNAWYPGSACPKDFGEIHNGCYNLVELTEQGTKVDRIPFNLPTYETLDIAFSDFVKLKSDLSNKYVRIRFECTKEEKKSMNLKMISDELKKRTQALSIKLEPVITESESGPKSNVIKHKSIVDKMAEYAKEKSLKVPKHAKELLQKIQDNTLIKYSFPQHSFELLYMSLRGAIGIRDGQHKEEYEINFERFDDGVVCLQGRTGAGKTTLVENCHPYPCMLTRDGTLKENFYLKDSHRILIYKDENGIFYKISMLIDGKTKTGKTVYFVETSKDRTEWTSLPEVDGSMESYKQWVESTFGSIDVFLRTAFFAKEQTKGIPDISATTKGERMELLSKLAGTDHLKEVSGIAREERKKVEKESDKIEAEIKAYSRYEDNIKVNEADIAEWNKEIKKQKTVISNLEKAVNELKIKDAEYQKTKAVSEANSKLYDQYDKEFKEKSERMSLLEKCSRNEKVFSNIAEYKETISRNEPLIEEKRKELSDKQKDRDSLQQDLTPSNKSLSKKTVEITKLDSEIELCKAQIIPIDEVCPTCGQPISKHKKEELEHIIDTSRKALEKLEEKKVSLQKELEDLQAENNDLEAKLKDNDTDINAVEKSLNDLLDQEHKCKSYIEKYDRIYSESTYKKVLEELKTVGHELDELQSKMDDIVDSEMIDDVSDELEEAEDQLEEEQDKLNELTSNIKAAEKENERYRKELEAVAGKKAELKNLTDKITAYNFIENAFSNNGIPAIELRESAPEIANIVNKILADSYGNKFEIRFGSTSELKAKRKANEDFNIIVYDTENGDEKTIDLVSSGERIWLKQALFYAFSIVQMNRTGFNFRTRLIDESDGSLDGGLRPKYLKMVTAAHAIASARITVLITHSQEIKDIAQQIIEI